jgi:hypothetical protein
MSTRVKSRTFAVVSLTACAALFLAGTAYGSSSVRITGNSALTLQVRGDKHTNDLEVAQSGTALIVTENMGSLEAGLGCSSLSSNSAVCSRFVPFAGISMSGAGSVDQLVLAETVNVPARISGGPEFDVLQGGAAADRLTGGPGADQMRGGMGADRYSGGSGDDQIDAVGFGPTLSGPDPDDRINCGGGSADFVEADPDDVAAASRSCETVQVGDPPPSS